LFPNPAVLGAALASQTKNIEIRAGSVVLPLNDEVRIAEDWSVVDNLSNGRVSLSIASGWHADDFVLMPQNYPQRHEIMFRQIEALKALWRGESIKRINGLDKEIEVKIFPRPLQPELPVWITSAGNRETFKAAGKIGAKILTHLLGQDVEDLEKNIVFYKQSLKENGYSLQDAKVAIMLHTYVGADLETVKTTVREPFKSYLRSSVSLVKNLVKSLNISNENFDENDIEAILEIAFERYWQTSALLGTVESCSPLVEKLHSIGVTEIASLIDFGIDDEKVMESLPFLDDLRKIFNQPVTTPNIPGGDFSALQITPSYLSALVEDKGARFFLTSLKHLIIGGERLPEALMEKLKMLTDAAIYNMYGPTETTIWSTVKMLENKSAVTIGTPIQNTFIYILDDEKKRCPVGVLGELYIGGDGLARGYYKKNELSQERFIQNPFSSNSTERIYRTGDLAKWLPNGEIEIAGRNDDQVKLNGYRIEPGEIEYVINQQEGVINCVVSVKEDEHGNKILVAYVRVNNSYNKAALFTHLKTKLPSYMVPALVMELEEFPLTSNGKINRKSLPAPVLLGLPADQYVAPVTELEKILADILKELLKIKRVGIHDNFFELGLHSLLAIRLVSAARRKLEVEFPVKELFEHPTISSLAGYLQGLNKGVTLAAIRSQPRPERIPLSFGQERLWFIDQLAGSIQYHLPAVFRIKGPLI
jgi:natural product biosynthesis luciferase-like monooxygenase protein